LVFIGAGFNDNSFPEPELILQTPFEIGENAHGWPYANADNALVACLVQQALYLLPGETESLADVPLGHVSLVIESGNLYEKSIVVGCANHLD